VTVSGHGRVEVSRDGNRSVVTSLTAASPLKLLTPRNHGRAAWIYSTSYGGGLVDGDALCLDLVVGAGAALYLTTQASTKIYPGTASQSLTADVGEQALLVALPDPVVPFAGARYRQRASLRLGATASLVWLESLTAGRVASGERWHADSYRSHLRVERGGLLLALDGLVLDPAHGKLAERLGRFDALATLLLVGPAAARLRQHVLDSGATDGPCLVAPSPLADDVAVARLAATGAEALARALHALLLPLADLLGDDPLARKVVSPDAMR
jgi:urease accessory protein